MDPFISNSNLYAYSFPDLGYYPFYPFYFPQNNNLCFYGWKSHANDVKHEVTRNEPGPPTSPSIQPPQEESRTEPREGSGADLKKRKKGSLIAFKKQKRQEVKYSEQYLENRNIVPNIACNILSYVRRIKRSGPVVEKIIHRLHNSQSEVVGTVKKFYAYQHYLKDNLSDFKGKEAIQVLVGSKLIQYPCFTEQEHKFYSQVVRILMNHYLEMVLFVDILSSNRVSKKNRTDYLKGKRLIKALIRGIDLQLQQTVDEQ